MQNGDIQNMQLAMSCCCCCCYCCVVVVVVIVAVLCDGMEKDIYRWSIVHDTDTRQLAPGAM